MSPIERIFESSALAQLEKAEVIFDSGIIEAFGKVRDGFSADRVVADPAINAAFVDECERIGISGDPRSWNHRLLRLRKAGKLAELATWQRTELSWEECDSFLFASEIAWKNLLDNGFGSLDDILCDPEAAEKFDSIAQSYAPGFTSLKYRWGALKLRKESKRARSRSDLLARAKMSPRQSISARSLAQIPAEPGVYLVHDNKHPLYAGESLNLSTRLSLQFGATGSKTWTENWGDHLAVSFFLSERKALLLLAYQSLYVRIHKPRLNIRDSALA